MAEAYRSEEACDRRERGEGSGADTKHGLSGRALGEPFFTRFSTARNVRHNPRRRARAERDSFAAALPASARCSAALHRLVALVESFRSNVCAIRPHNRAAIEEEFAKILGILQRFEDGPLQPWSEVDRPFRLVAELQVDAVATAILSTHHRGKNAHSSTSLKRLDPLERTTRLHVFPVRLE